MPILIGVDRLLEGTTGISIAGIAGFAKMRYSLSRVECSSSQSILESIDVVHAYPELTSELKQELDRRARAYDANPDDVITREAMRASIRRR